MQSLAILVFTVVSSFVAIVNWSRIRKPDILLPSIGIALVGGVANVVSTTYVQDFSPTPFMYVYVVGFSLLITASGLYLAEKAGLPGLWPQPQAQQVSRPLLAGIGALMGVAVGLGLWRIGLVGAPGVPGFLQALRTLEGPEAKIHLILLVIQSGLVEEPMYRLFAISAIAESLSSAGVNRTTRTTIAVLASSLAFGVIPTHNFLVSSLVGLLFGVAHLRLGLVPLIIAHCVTNAVQFPLLLGWW